jgi:sulfide:quinone oxidoreductase
MPVKCPAAPVAFILLAEEEMKKRGIRERCRFVLTVPTPLIPPGREPFTGALEKVLRERDIEVVADFTLSALESEKGVCRDFLGREVPFDLLCVTPPHTGEKVVLAAKELADPSGWVMCDKNKLEHKKFDNIYAVGDAGNFPSAKAASAARKQAYVLSKRIKAHIAGGVPAEVYDGNAICPVLTSFGRAMFAEFDYDRSISQAKESASKWLLHVRYFRRLYWHFLLKGRFFD